MNPILRQAARVAKPLFPRHSGDGFLFRTPQLKVGAKAIFRDTGGKTVLIPITEGEFQALEQLQDLHREAAFTAETMGEGFETVDKLAKLLEKGMASLASRGFASKALRSPGPDLGGISELNRLLDRWPRIRGNYSAPQRYDRIEQAVGRAVTERRRSGADARRMLEASSDAMTEAFLVNTHARQQANVGTRHALMVQDWHENVNKPGIRRAFQKMRQLKKSQMLPLVALGSGLGAAQAVMQQREEGRGPWM